MVGDNVLEERRCQALRSKITHVDPSFARREDRDALGRREEEAQGSAKTSGRFKDAHSVSQSPT
jgi:hypothetical protein